MSEWESMSREQLLAVVVEQQARIEATAVQVAELTARLGAELGELLVAAVLGPVRQAPPGPAGADNPEAGACLPGDPWVVGQSERSHRAFRYPVWKAFL
ncbi:MAG TPA: hypothetical protein VFJ97_02085 [Dermatophilaceae bacterium]|nr:hypothetical protein [Dermatophilaceae bacterium]